MLEEALAAVPAPKPVKAVLLAAAPVASAVLGGGTNPQADVKLSSEDGLESLVDEFAGADIFDDLASWLGRGGASACSLHGVSLEVVEIY